MKEFCCAKSSFVHSVLAKVTLMSFGGRDFLFAVATLDSLVLLLVNS